MLVIKRSSSPSSSNCTTLNISDIEIQLLRKNIKHINFSVKASDGQVCVSAPKSISDDELLVAIHSKIGWIRKKIQIINNLPSQPAYNYSSGEQHYYLGNPYYLEVVKKIDKPSISITAPGNLVMCVQNNATIHSREMLLNEWYRAALKQRIPLLIEKWQPIIGKTVSEWGVKRMKTRWGTCNISKSRIWLNLELAKYPEACLEYVVVHEMTHLLERNHTSRFKELLDGFIPDWKKVESILNTNLITGESLERN